MPVHIYEALTAFGMCLKLALSSRSFFEDGAFSEAQIRTYKKDLKFFTERRIQARRDAQEEVDFSVYEGQIRRMIDQQVIGKQIAEPEGFISLGDLGQSDEPETWSDEKTRTEADLIKTRIRKTIEQDLLDDPYARKVFSELLRQAIREAEALFDHPGKQYTLFKDLEEQVRNRSTPGMPAALEGNRMAQAFFGVLLMDLDEDAKVALGEETMTAEALHIDQIVEDAIAANAINPTSIEAAIRQSLLPRLFRLLGGLNPANTVLDRLVEVVRAGALGKGSA